MKKDWAKWLPFKKTRSETPATTTAGAPADPFARMRQEMDRMFEGFLGRAPATAADHWFGDFSAKEFSPTIDLADRPEQLVITAELPGIDEDDVRVEMHEDAVVLTGEKKEEKTSEEDGYYRTERSFGSFSRTIPLPAEVDGDKAEARFEKGVLTVVLPKRAPRSPSRAIPISK